MSTTIEAEVDETGTIRPKEAVDLKPGSRVLVILEPGPSELTLLSEPALAVDWQRPEEDEAWSPPSHSPPPEAAGSREAT